IRVADAKVREAEAEGQRTRLKVAGDLASLHADLTAARLAEEQGLLRYERAKSLYLKKVIPEAELDLAHVTYQNLSAKRASLEAKLPFLLGRQPGSSTSSKDIDAIILKNWLSAGSDKGISDTEFLR